MDHQARGRARLLVAERAFEVLVPLVLDQDLLVGELPVAVEAPHPVLGLLRLLLLLLAPHRVGCESTAWIRARDAWARDAAERVRPVGSSRIFIGGQTRREKTKARPGKPRHAGAG